jgi:hypothetical protein
MNQKGKKMTHTLIEKKQFYSHLYRVVNDNGLLII